VPRLSGKFINPLKIDLIGLATAENNNPSDASSNSSLYSPGVEIRPRARHALLRAQGDGNASEDFDLFAGLSAKPAPAPEPPKAPELEDDYADESFEKDHLPEVKGKKEAPSRADPARPPKHRSASPTQPSLDKADDLKRREQRRMEAKEYLEQKRRERLKAYKESREAGTKEKQNIREKLKQLEEEVALRRKNAPQSKQPPAKPMRPMRKVGSPLNAFGDENVDNRNGSIVNALFVASHGDIMNEREFADEVLTTSAVKQLRASRYADVSDDNLDNTLEIGLDDTGNYYEHSDVILSPSRNSKYDDGYYRRHLADRDRLSSAISGPARDGMGELPVRAVSAPPKMALLKRHERKNVEPRGPFKVGKSTSSAQRRAASMGGGAKLARTLNRSKSTPNLLTYASVDSSPPPPPPPRRPGSSSLAKRRPASTGRVAPTRSKAPAIRTGRGLPPPPQPLRGGKQDHRQGDDIFEIMDSETRTARPTEAPRPNAQLSKTVSVLKQVEKSMLEYQESVKLVHDALQQKLRKSLTKEDVVVESTSPNSTADSDSVDLHLGAIRESVASALSAALAKSGSVRQSIERGSIESFPIAPEVHDCEDEEQYVNYESSHGSSSYNSSSDEMEQVNDLHEDSIGREELVEENQDLENVVLHRESGSEEESKAGFQYQAPGDSNLSTEAKLYRRSAIASMVDGPPPCRASHRQGAKLYTGRPSRDSLESVTGSFDELKLAAGRRSAPPRPRDFETEDPVFRTQMGMMNDKRDILAFYGAPRSIDSDGYYRDSSEWDQRQSMDNPFISDKLRSQGYYEDRFASDWTDNKPDEQYQVPSFVTKEATSESDEALITVEKHQPPVSLRNVGGLGNTIPAIHGRGAATSNRRGLFFRHDGDSDESEASGDDFERPLSRPSDPFVEGAVYDDPRDVSIMSIFAKKQLKAMQEEKDRLAKEKIVREVKELQRAAESDLADASTLSHPPPRVSTSTAADSEEEEEKQQRTFWDSLLRRPLHSFGSDLEPTDDDDVEDATPPERASPSRFSRQPAPAAQNEEKKLTPSEMRLRLMNALEHHEQLVGYEAELAEMHRIQALQTASDMMFKATSQAEVERLHAAYSQEAILQQQAYELTLAASLNSQRENERAAERERLRFAEEVERNAIVQNNILERAQFEVDAAQTIANLQNATRLFELEQKIQSESGWQRHAETQPTQTTVQPIDVAPTDASEALLSPSQLNESIDAALKAQDRVFRLRMIELTRERDAQLDLSRQRFEELEARGLNASKQRQLDEKRILKIFSEAMAELDRERWIMKEEICRRLDIRSLVQQSVETPDRLMLHHDAPLSPLVSSPMSTKADSTKKSVKYDESYRSDFVGASQSFMTDISSTVAQSNNIVKTAPALSIEEPEISSEEEPISRASLVMEEDSEVEEEEEVRSQVSASMKSVSEEDLYDEDGFESEGRLSKTNDSDSIMNDILRKQESVRRKHEEIERLIKTKTETLQKKKELILLEEEERELNALIAEAGTIDVRFDAEKFRNKLRSEARRRVEALAAQMLKSPSSSVGSPPRLAQLGAPIPSKIKSFEQSAAYDEDFEEIPDDVVSNEVDAEESVQEELAEYSADIPVAKSIIVEEIEHAIAKPIDDVVSDADEYNEDFEVSGSILKSSSKLGKLKVAPRVDESMLESASVGNFIFELDQSVDMHRERIEDLRKTLSALHGQKGKLEVIKAKLRDRQALLEVENKLLRDLESEAAQLREEKENIRKERLAIHHYSGPSIDLMRLEESVTALEMSANKDVSGMRKKWLQDVAATDAALAEEDARQKRQAESDKVVHDIVAVLEEPLEEELAILDEQALVEEDSWASEHISDASGDFEQDNLQPLVDKAVASEAEAGLKSSIAHRIVVNDAATRIQSAYRCSLARARARAMRAERIDRMMQSKKKSIEGNLLTENAYTAYAEELLLEDSFASSEDEGLIEVEKKVGGLALADTEELLVAVEKLKSASADRVDLEVQVLASRAVPKVSPESVAVMESIVLPSSEMKFDASAMKWVETGDNKVDMSGFDESVDESIEEIPKGKTQNMEFDEVNMKWVGGEPVDMSGFDESSEDEVDQDRSKRSKEEQSFPPTQAVASNFADTSAYEDDYEEEFDGIEPDQDLSRSEKVSEAYASKKDYSLEQSEDVPGPPEDEDSVLLEAVDESIEVEEDAMRHNLSVDPVASIVLGDSAAETINWEKSPRKPDSVNSEENASSESDSLSGEASVVEATIKDDDSMNESREGRSEELFASGPSSSKSPASPTSPPAASPRSKLAPIDITNRIVDRASLLLDSAVNSPRSKLLPITAAGSAKSPAALDFPTSPSNKVKLAQLSLSPSESLGSPKASLDRYSDEDSSLEDSFVSQSSFSEPSFPPSARSPEAIDTLTNELLRRMVASEMSQLYDAERRSGKDQDGSSPEKTGVRLLRSLSSSSELPPIHGPGPLSRHHSFEDDEFVAETVGSKVAEDERLQMHQQLSHELDELYEFEDDIHVPSLESASPPKDDPKSGGGPDAVVEDAQRLEELASEKIELSLFWSNRVLVRICLTLVSLCCDQAISDLSIYACVFRTTRRSY
jgi:hypothetical protein